jgi:5'-3' exonuclease
MLVDEFDESTKLNVWIDGSAILYASLFGASKTFNDNNNVLKPAKETDQDDLPDLTIYPEYIRLLETKLSDNINRIINRCTPSAIAELGFVSTTEFFFVLDSVRESNWRYRYFKEYKIQRQTVEKQFQVGKAFDYLVNIIIPKINFDEYFNMTSMVLEGVEGDDIIGVSCMERPDQKHLIIASDHDYLQLLSDTIIQYDVGANRIEYNPSKFGFDTMTSKQFLLCKILSGDKSDNIPNVFTRCGPKTAGKLVKDTTLLKEKLNGDQTAMRQFKLNTKLIDFNQIPKDKKEAIISYVNTTIQ